MNLFQITIYFILCLSAWSRPVESWDWEHEALYLRSRWEWALKQKDYEVYKMTDAGWIVVFPVDSMKRIISEQVTPHWPGFPRAASGQIIVGIFPMPASTPLLAPWHRYFYYNYITPDGTKFFGKPGLPLSYDYGEK